MSLLIEFLEFIEIPPGEPVGKLLSRVLLKSRQITNAEAGTFFVLHGRGPHRKLEASSLKNDRVRLKSAGFVIPVTTSSIAGYVATTGEIVIIDDLYAIPAGRSYSFNPAFDQATGYQSRSMLCFPLQNYAGELTGVVQLLNRRLPGSDKPVPFTRDQVDLIGPINHIVGTAIERAQMVDRIHRQNKRLRERARLLTEQRSRIEALQDETEDAFQISIRLLARAAELHDEDTGNHILRTNEYSYYLAKCLDMPDDFCDEIRYSAQLHDVGKMSVDAAVLKKRGGLSSLERDEINRHPYYGYKILSASDRLRMAAEIAYCHHEKWDGTGYPRKLKGDEIPLSARIVQIADIYDALRSERPYKPAFSHERSVAIITKGDDRIDPRAHFDPRLIDLFAANHEGMDRLWCELADPPGAVVAPVVQHA